MGTNQIDSQLYARPVEIPQRLIQFYVGRYPEGTPIPLLLSGVTDGRYFSRIGVQTYGLLPMPLPEDFNFSQTIHAANERVPANAIRFGADAIYQAL